MTNLRLRCGLPLACAVFALAPAATATAATKRADSCQPYAQACLLPFPNDLYTVRDKSTPTGRRVHLPTAAMPVNKAGVRIPAADYNRADGFSPGGTIVLRLPGLDNPGAVRRSHIVGLADLSQYTAKSQSLLLVDEKTHKRQLVWGEIDSHAGARADTTFLIHAGRSLTEGHRYVVALRNVRNAKGRRVSAPGWFRRLRDGRKGGPKSLQRDRGRYTRIFKVLRKAGVKRADLTVAWDFTVASRQSLTGRLLHIRNDAFAQLGDDNLADGKIAGHAPSYGIDNVEDFTPAEDPDIARRVTGHISVPCYLDKTGCPSGARYHFASKGKNALPSRRPGNTQVTQFICNIPRAALTHPARVSLYGHGLLGDPGEVNAGNVEDMAQEHDVVFCATRWSGMADEDVIHVAGVLGDLSQFPTVADRLQQGMVNFLYLGRLLDHPQGLVADPAFKPGGVTTLDRSHLYYDGNSQGGIFGGILTAISPDFTRAVLGVSGLDYGGLLLERSSDWPQYEAILGGGYPDKSERPLLLALIQQLWDRGEPDGYAAHMTSHPLPGTPKHTVLMQIALGDQQVSDFAAEVEARTIGAHIYRPALDKGRWPGKQVGFGIPTIGKFPYRGSAIVYWDSGAGHNGPPPLGNIAPTKGEDPHSNPRSTKAARVQKSAFLEPNGSVIDVCGAKPCHSDAFTP